jgi:hypothetical protein
MKMLPFLLNALSQFNAFHIFLLCLSLSLISLVLIVPERVEPSTIRYGGYDVNSLQIAGTTILFVLGCEYLVESAIEFAFPPVDPTFSRCNWGYGVLILSLVFSSTITSFLYSRDEIDALVCWSHFGKAIAVFGVMERAATFEQNTWDPILSLSTVASMWGLTVVRLLTSRPRSEISKFLSHSWRMNLLIASNGWTVLQSCFLIAHSVKQLKIIREQSANLSKASLDSKPRHKLQFKESPLTVLHRLTSIALSLSLGCCLILDCIEKIVFRWNSGDDPNQLLYSEIRSHTVIITVTAIIPLRILGNRFSEVLQNERMMVSMSTLLFTCKLSFRFPFVAE